MVAISVVLPNYNGSRFLRKAVDSILGQTFSDFELLLIDDGSTDTSREIIRDYARCDFRIRPHFLDHAGLPNALNHGIAHAESLFIARMDSDDISLPQRFEAQYTFMQSNPEVWVLGTAVETIDAFGNVLDRHSVLTEQDAILKNLEVACPVWHPSVMLRRAPIVAIGGYDTAFPCAEDYALWRKVASHGGLITNVPDILFQYRIHEHSISVSKADMQKKSHNRATAAFPV